MIRTDISDIYESDLAYYRQFEDELQPNEEQKISPSHGKNEGLTTGG